MFMEIQPERQSVQLRGKEENCTNFNEFAGETMDRGRRELWRASGSRSPGALSRAPDVLSFARAGSGKGKADTHVSSKKGGKKGGAASSARTAEERSASAKKAAATRKKNKSKSGA
jgi:hypothetical protein